MARKTHTSTEVKTRWMKNNYKKYVISLRFDTDGKLIDYVESRKEKDGTTNIFREALDALIEKENK